MTGKVEAASEQHASCQFQGDPKISNQSMKLHACKLRALCTIIPGSLSVDVTVLCIQLLAGSCQDKTCAFVLHFPELLSAP